ncbi:MAG: FG-GAP-like repeat-containing protein [Planctomycetota bacterium]
MNRYLLLAPFLAAPPLAAQAQNEYSGIEEFLTVTRLEHSAFHFKMNRVTNAGDVNGDGVDDFLIGSPGANSDAGSAFVISGKVALKGAPEPIEILRVDGLAGQALGAGVCGLGDLNNDGKGDIAVASSAGQFIDIISGADGTVLATISATGAGTEFGTSMAKVDLDGDGVPELAVGDPSLTTDGGAHTGTVEIFELRTLGDDSLSVTSLARAEGVGREFFGTDLARLGTGTNADFLVVGAPRMDGTLTENSPGGKVFVLRDDPSTVAFDLETIVAIEDNQLQNLPGKFGFSVTSVGDISGNDGIEEFAVGAPENNSTATASGVVHVFDTAGNTIMTLNGLLTDEGFGMTVTGMGDVDGDQVPDFAVGAPGLIAGPGAVTIHSGTNGSTIDTIPGARAASHLGMAVAAAGDVDGDGSRDLMITEFDTRPDFSMVHIMRPLHSLPYRIKVNATATGKEFAAVHGVNHGPLHKGKWSKRLNADHWLLTNFDADFCQQYDDLKIPQSRVHQEGPGDMNYLWRVVNSDPDNYTRDYDVFESEINNLDNYHFRQMDERMDAVDNMEHHDTVFRIGHNKAIDPVTGEWVTGFHEPPNSFRGFSDVVAGIMKHYNQGWGRDMPGNPIDIVELWNEPHLASWSGTGTQFADLHVEVLKALDRELDNNGDGVADDLTVLVPLSAGYVGGFSAEYLDQLDMHFNPLNPAATRLDGVVGHFYGTDPSELVEKFEYYDDLFTDIEENRSIFKTGPGMTTELPEIWVTEWNRTLDKYAFKYASMPFIMNTFFYMNQLSAGEAKRHDGGDMRVRLGGAQFFGPHNMWRAGINPNTNMLDSLPDHAGLAWEVYGKTLYQDANQRLEVQGSFHEGEIGEANNATKDFTVMAGRSETEELVVLVISSLRITEDNEHPNLRDETQRLPYVVDVDDLGFTPLTVERMVQSADKLQFLQGRGAELGSVPEFGSNDLPYGAWTASLDAGTASISVGDMIENSYEVIIIRGQAPEAPTPDAPGPDAPDGGDEPNLGPGMNTMPDAPSGHHTVDRNQLTDLNAGSGQTQNATAGSGNGGGNAKRNKRNGGGAKAKRTKGKGKGSMKRGKKGRGANGKAKRGKRTSSKVKGNKGKKGGASDGKAGSKARGANARRKSG